MAEPAEHGIPILRRVGQHLPQHQHDDDAGDRIGVELGRPPPQRERAAGESVLHHPPGIDRPDQQAGQEHESLGVLHETELGVIHAHEQKAARERHVIEEHEDEEIASKAVDHLKPSHAAPSAQDAPRR